MMGGGLWLHRGPGPPGGGVRGSHFHLPRSTLPYCARCPARPRVLSPAPRRPACPRLTRIRGAFGANCQEGPEVSLLLRSPWWRAGPLGVSTFRCGERRSTHCQGLHPTRVSLCFDKLTPLSDLCCKILEGMAVTGQTDRSGTTRSLAVTRGWTRKQRAGAEGTVAAQVAQVTCVWAVPREA